MSNATQPTLAADALHGLAGDFVTMVEPHSESDPVALLVQFLVSYGSAIGRGPHFVAEASRHHTNLYLVIVGRTSKGRKGTSLGQVQRAFELADPVWSKLGAHGLSSGEGLIWAVRDPITKTVPVKEKGKRTGEYEEVVVDPGVEDKRLLVFEAEFAQCLAVLEREGNTLSSVLRGAWDSGDLRSLTKNSPARATGAHISIIAHCTQEEVLRRLDRTEAANGFGNRFLWLCAQRSKSLPEGGRVPADELQEFALRLRGALEFGMATLTELRRDTEARSLWAAAYPKLSEGRPGLLGAVTARAEAQTMRLALLYALLDSSDTIRVEHLRAGLALWKYAEDSASAVFGASLGDPIADEILRALRASPDGLTRTQISELFSHNRGKQEIGRALGVLLTHGLARSEVRETAGRAKEVWHAIVEASGPRDSSSNPSNSSRDYKTRTNTETAGFGASVSLAGVRVERSEGESSRSRSGDEIDEVDEARAGAAS